MPINPAKIFSVLGSQSSLVPLAVKDTFASMGMTAGSYVTGKEEGVDRFIDEVGTEIIWLGGIPAYKWLFDKTVFKVFNLDAKFDARNLKNKEIFERIKKYAPSKEIHKSLEKISQKQGLVKKLAASKFIVSTGLSILSYILLTNLKQKFTEKQIKKHLVKEHATLNRDTDDKNTGENPSFKSLSSVAESLAYNSVRNMWILDGAITSERLLASRSPQELAGYAIKEAFALCFLYYAGGKVQDMIEENSIKKHNRNISLDSKILEDNYIKDIFKNGTVKDSLEAFNKISNESNGKKSQKKAVELYDFIFKNPENAIVKMAKQSGLIKTYKNSGKIDSRKYIDLEKFENINKNLSQLYSQYNEALSKGISTEEFFKKLTKLKRHSIITNIAVSVFALGILAPSVMLLKRKFIDKDDEFQTKKVIREKLVQDGIIS